MASPGAHGLKPSPNSQLPLSSRERRSPSRFLCFLKEIIKTRTEPFQQKPSLPSKGNHTDIPPSAAAPCFVLCACKSPAFRGIACQGYISHRELNRMMNSLGSHCSNKHCCFFFSVGFFLLVFCVFLVLASLPEEQQTCGPYWKI